jgi:hypothetical protein
MPVIAALNGGDELVCHFRGRHFGLQVIGRHFGRLRHEAILTVERHLAPAVQEEGHVGVLLGLGQTELGFSLHRHPFAQRVDQ